MHLLFLEGLSASELSFFFFAQDGISLVQTTEGALTETHAMLQRLKTLAVQSSNGTYSTADRNLIDKEVKQLTSEITRIASQTEFNGKQVLASDSLKISFQVGNKSGQEISVSMKSMGANALGLSSLSLSTDVKFQINCKHKFSSFILFLNTLYIKKSK